MSGLECQRLNSISRVLGTKLQTVLSSGGQNVGKNELKGECYSVIRLATETRCDSILSSRFQTHGVFLFQTSINTWYSLLNLFQDWVLQQNT